MKSKKQIKVVLDNGGGAAMAVFCKKYAHGYDDMQQLADDIICLRDDNSVLGWDNNQWGTGVTQSDGSCRTYYGTPQQVINAVINDDDYYGANLDNLQAALTNAEVEYAA